MVPLPPGIFPIASHPGDLLIDTALVVYFLSLAGLFLIAGQSLILLLLQSRTAPECPPGEGVPAVQPVVTIQLPVFNELHVIDRLIGAVCAMRYPRELLEIQVLDDSTDETSERIDRLIRAYREAGHDICVIRRGSREGFKSGALQAGLAVARGEFLAIFDADFVPRPDFVERTLPYFADPCVAMVQTRWEHLNESYSALTRVQAFGFDGHFALEQRVRSAAGHFLTFNGTGGIWRAAAIHDSGGWQHDTLTEDLDLSFRAQLRGWRLIYRNDLTSPGELPADFNAFRLQQYRWTKGYIETARKVLPLLWRSNLPISRKILSSLHLTGTMAFPLMLVVAVLNGPVALVKAGGGYEVFFLLLSVFVAGFLMTFIAATQSQRVLHRDWIRRMAYFPVYLAGSMGLSVSNTRAVIDAFRESDRVFVRTPKSAVQKRGERWEASAYSVPRAGKMVILEILMAVYCFFGVVSSLYRLEFFAVPFQLLFATGFSLVAMMSLTHARNVRRSRTTTQT